MTDRYIMNPTSTSSPEPQRTTFSTTLFREGYDQKQVDEFVARIERALAGMGPTLTADDVRGVRFTPVRLRHGYDMREVDNYLDAAVRKLAATESGAVCSCRTQPGHHSH